VSGDPLRTGLVASLSHPGDNVTGLSLLSGEYNVKWLELLKEAVPTSRRVAVLWNPDDLASAEEIESMRRVAPVMGLELTAISVRPTEIDANLREITNANLDGFVVSDDPFLATQVPRLIALAAERRVPAIYPFGNSAMQGGLMAYSANFFQIWRQAADYVDRILKGARPADLPIEQATNFAFGGATSKPRKRSESLFRCRSWSAAPYKVIEWGGRPCPTLRSVNKMTNR
jgi:putative ABC transport system substrate-binding protein